MPQSKRVSKSVKPLLRSAHPSIRQYIVKLESINTNLHKKIGELEAQLISDRNRITLLEKQRDRLKTDLENVGPQLQIVVPKPSKPTQSGNKQLKFRR